MPIGNGHGSQNRGTQNGQSAFQEALVALALVVLTGCGGCSREDAKTNAEPEGKPFEGLTIDVAVPAGRNIKSDWQSALSEWSFLNGAQAQITEYAMPEASGEFAKLLNGPDKPAEVMLIPWSAVPELMAAEGLAEIPDAVQSQEQLNWVGYFFGLRNRIATAAGKPRLVPISCPVLVCYYREDLLEQAGLSPPKTWEQYQTLVDTLPDWAPGLVAVEPWGEEFRASLFLARAAAVAKHPEQFSFCFDLSSGEPLIDNPGFVEALKQAKATLAKMPAEVKTYSPADCRREILTGKAALAIGYETQQAQNIPRGENVRIGISPLPGARRVYNTAIDDWVEFGEERIHQVTYTGFTGWAFAVAGKLEDVPNTAAWELTRYMAVDQLPQSYPVSMISLCRDSQMASASQWTGPQLTTSESEEYVSVVSQSLRSDQITMELPLIGQSEFRSALTKGLTTALTQNGEVQAVLKRVADEWRAIIQKLGPAEVAKSYQRSHE